MLNLPVICILIAAILLVLLWDEIIKEEKEDSYYAEISFLEEDIYCRKYIKTNSKIEDFNKKCS